MWQIFQKLNLKKPHKTLQKLLNLVVINGTPMTGITDIQ
jgi:hypothetical protein